MSTVVVWVLVIFTYGHPVVVDNIASERNCRGLADSIGGSSQRFYTCSPVRKVVR